MAVRWRISALDQEFETDAAQAAALQAQVGQPVTVNDGRRIGEVTAVHQDETGVYVDIEMEVDVWAALTLYGWNPDETTGPEDLLGAMIP